MGKVFQQAIYGLGNQNGLEIYIEICKLINQGNINWNNRELDWIMQVLARMDVGLGNSGTSGRK